MQDKVDVIVAETNPHVAIARRLTSTTPIVMLYSTDPVGSGFVASLARPGGNVTGLTYDPGPDLTSKPMQYLKEMRPTLSRLAVIHILGNPAWATHDQAARQSAQALQLSIEFLDTYTLDEVEAAFAAAKKMNADALVCWIGGRRGIRWRERIATMALQAGLPSASQHLPYADAGGLLAFGTDALDLNRRGAGYVDKILRGAKPADLPVEQPTKFELALNRRTAKALGITTRARCWRVRTG